MLHFSQYFESVKYVLTYIEKDCSTMLRANKLSPDLTFVGVRLRQDLELERFLGRSGYRSFCV